MNMIFIYCQKLNKPKNRKIFPVLLHAIMTDMAISPSSGAQSN